MPFLPRCSLLLSPSPLRRKLLATLPEGGWSSFDLVNVHKRVVGSAQRPHGAQGEV